MELNYLIIIPVIIIIAALVIFLIRRNRKDENELEQRLNKPDLKPEKHDEDNI